MRFLLAVLVVASVPILGATTDERPGPNPVAMDDQIIRLMAQQAQFIAVAEVEELPIMLNRTGAWIYYGYGFKLVAILRGDAPGSTSFDVCFKRAIPDSEPSIKKGEKYVVFVRPRPGTTSWDLVSNYYGIMPYSQGLERYIQYVVSK